MQLYPTVKQFKFTTSTDIMTAKYFNLTFLDYIFFLGNRWDCLCVVIIIHMSAMING